MSGIRAKNTKPEIRIRQLLHKSGLRYQLHVCDLPGKPDIVLPRFNAVVFVHGCFWHGHRCHLFRWPSSRREFWRNKIIRNRRTDARAVRALALAGWRVAVIWECALKGRSRIPDEIITRRLTTWLRNSSPKMEITGKSRQQ